MYYKLFYLTLMFRYAERITNYWYVYDKCLKPVTIQYLPHYLCDKFFVKMYTEIFYEEKYRERLED